jgi:hypothetical protein
VIATLRAACCLILTFQLNALQVAGPAPTHANAQESKLQPAPQGPTLEDGTPVKLRISQTVSSADAHVNDRVEFEVLEDIKVLEVVIIPKGGIAWGTVTLAQHKRRMGRGGKLDIVMDSVRLADGERAPLRATKEARGGGHVGAMTIGIVASGLLFFPVAPLFLLVQGKDITIQKGTEVPTFIDGHFQLDLAKFPAPSAIPQSQAASPVSSLSPENQPAVDAQIEITSIPTGAEIELDGAFVGNTPSTVSASAGDHDLVVKKNGFKVWERMIKVTGGKIMMTAELAVGSDSTENSH